jgi:ABC-type sulfate/molybdate transport systems ATPase subunit
MNPSRPSLIVRGLRKTIADFVLTAEFEVRGGERAALISRSGMGKTSLLRIIAGLEEFEGAGGIALGTEDLTRLPVQKRGIGYVFQDQALFPALNVFENVVFGLRMAGVPHAERETRGMEWLNRIGLKHRARVSVGTLSGGEAQRVALARAWITQPRVLLLDEPFSSLDLESRQELRNVLRELHESWPVPLLLVSHDPSDLDALATVRLELRDEERAEKGHLIRSVVRRP